MAGDLHIGTPSLKAESLTRHPPIRNSSPVPLPTSSSSYIQQRQFLTSFEVTTEGAQAVPGTVASEAWDCIAHPEALVPAPIPAQKPLHSSATMPCPPFPLPRVSQYLLAWDEGDLYPCQRTVLPRLDYRLAIWGSLVSSSMEGKICQM